MKYFLIVLILTSTSACQKLLKDATSDTQFKQFGNTKWKWVYSDGGLSYHRIQPSESNMFVLIIQIDSSYTLSVNDSIYYSDRLHSEINNLNPLFTNAGNLYNFGDPVTRPPLYLMHFEYIKLNGDTLLLTDNATDMFVHRFVNIK